MPTMSKREAGAAMSAWDRPTPTRLSRPSRRPLPPLTNPAFNRLPPAMWPFSSSASSSYPGAPAPSSTLSASSTAFAPDVPSTSFASPPPPPSTFRDENTPLRTEDPDTRRASAFSSVDGGPPVIQGITSKWTEYVSSERAPAPPAVGQMRRARSFSCLFRVVSGLTETDRMMTSRTPTRLELLRPESQPVRRTARRAFPVRAFSDDLLL